VEHDVVADTSDGILILKCKANCVPASINKWVGSLNIISHSSEEMIVEEGRINEWGCVKQWTKVTEEEEGR
jgi:hypothetical protein